MQRINKAERKRVCKAADTACRSAYTACSERALSSKGFGAEGSFFFRPPSIGPLWEGPLSGMQNRLGIDRFGVGFPRGIDGEQFLRKTVYKWEEYGSGISRQEEE
ncbi:hypothetical protein CDAR_398561 [Caerostris darwini]|uniref:Uncharacterized protein n=1 Tax=Caerostris darwini TaxID=1538125 RepID=A0AAV4VET0_9ARAC|nr:hypothetical protein CDAR_398561 [Caerostris darwini]